jgi:hypothetical protein
MSRIEYACRPDGAMPTVPGVRGGFSGQGIGVGGGGSTAIPMCAGAEKLPELSKAGLLDPVSGDEDVVPGGVPGDAVVAVMRTGEPQVARDGRRIAVRQ